MNEPLRIISTYTRNSDHGPSRGTVAVDRLGSRHFVNRDWPPSYKTEVNPLINKEPRRIVVVEDSDDDAELLAIGVRKSGHSVKVDRAGNVDEAYRLLRGSPPSLVLLDCHLSGESGLDILGEIRSRESYLRVPIVMLSGTESDADIESAYLLGANSFLRKSYSFEEYVGRIGLLLDYWLTQNCVNLSR